MLSSIKKYCSLLLLWCLCHNHDVPAIGIWNAVFEICDCRDANIDRQKFKPAHPVVFLLVLRDYAT